MNYKIEIKDEAHLEIIEAYHYYEAERMGLGEDFLTHLDIYLTRISTYPEHFPQKRKPYRQAFIKRFPYLIVYEVTENKVIVYAVFNTHRNPHKKPK